MYGILKALCNSRTGVQLGRLPMVEVEVEVYPGVRRPAGTRDQFFFLLEFPLDSCGLIL
jgi:hypothetical protein